MFEVHDREPEASDDGGDEDRELFVQMAIKLAACLPNDPAQGKIILDMVQTMYATLTDLRQARDRALAG